MMHPYLQVALSNALAVGVLGILVYIIGRVVRRPALIHCLWLVVLVKLVTPPIVSIPVVATAPDIPVDVDLSVTFRRPNAPVDSPAADTFAQTHERPDLPGEVTPRPDTDLQQSPSTRAVVAASPVEPRRARISIWSIILAIWALGTCVLLTRSVSRVLRFRGVLKHMELADDSVCESVNSMAARMGIRHPPRPIIVPGAVSPMLWTFSPQAKLLLPADLMDSLDQDAVETLITHELAHFRRRDHWVRVLELVVTALFWWHPVTWLAIREIRNLEEQCCDAWVVAQLPERRGTYARTLVETVKFLSSGPNRVPAAAGFLGQGLYQTIEQRVRAIMSQSLTRGFSMSPTMRFGMILFALLVLPFMPVAGDDSDTVKTAKTNPAAKQAVKEPTSFAGSVLTLGNVSDLAVSPDGRMVVAGHGRAGGPGALSAWDLEELRPIASFKEQRQAHGISFSPDGKLVAYGTWGNLVRVRHTQTFEVVQELRGFMFKPVKTAFSGDGKWLVLAQNNRVELYDTTTWNKASLELEEDSAIDKASFEFHGVEVSGDGSRLIAAGFNRDQSDFYSRAVVWDTKTGKIVSTTAIDSPVTGARFSPDGKRFATIGARIQICDAVTGAIQRDCIFRSTNLYDIGWSPDGKQIVGAGSVRGYGIFDVESGELQHLFDQPNDPKIRYNTCRFTPDGKRIITGNSESKVRVWDASTHELLAEFPSSTETNTSAQPVLAIACSADGNWIAAGREDTTVTIHNASNGGLVKVLEGHEDVVPAVAFGINGMVASASYDETIKVWDVKSGEEFRTLEGHENWVFGIAFSPDGKQLASCGYDKTIRLWNVASGEQTARIEGHSAAVRSVAFSPDGQKLASASSDRTIKIWDAASGKELAALKGHRGTVRSIAFSSDGKTLVSGSEDNTARLWNVTDGTERSVLTGHEGMVWWVAFSPRGSNVVTSGFDRTVKVWDPTTGRIRQTLRGHTDVVSSVAFTADSSAVVSGSLDRTIRIWRGTGKKTAAAFQGQQIHVSNSDGSGLRLLVTGTEFDHHGSPDWSPDGRLIAYDAWKGSAGQNFRQAHVFIVRPDGTGLKDLGDGAIPRVSPDGKRIVFCRYKPQGIWVMNVDGTNREMLEPDGWGPTWSPDGKSLAYTVYTNDAGNIRVLDLENKSERLVLEGEHGGQYGGIYWGMRWSPDGNWIAFRGIPDGGGQEIAVVSADGSSQAFDVISKRVFQHQISWRPDSQGFVTSINEQGRFRLYEFKRDPKATPTLLDCQPQQMINRSCDWSPDGSQLAIVCQIAK